MMCEWLVNTSGVAYRDPLRVFSLLPHVLLAEILRGAKKLLEAGLLKLDPERHLL